MSKLTTLELAIVMCLGGLVLVRHRALAADKEAGQEDLTPRRWFYQDMPAEGKPDQRSSLEQYFDPFYFYPVDKARDISVDVKKTASDLVPDEPGTCIEILMRMRGADDWAGVGFMAGGKIGAKDPRDIIRVDKFVVGFNRPVFLKWRARTEKDSKIKVHFEAFGFSSGKTSDGIRPALTPDPETSALTDQWTEFSINLTDDATKLNKVVSPLRVIVRANDNAGVNKAVVYLDDVRLEITKPEK